MKQDAADFPAIPFLCSLHHMLHGLLLSVLSLYFNNVQGAAAAAACSWAIKERTSDASSKRRLSQLKTRKDPQDIMRRMDMLYVTLVASCSNTP